MTRLIGVLIGAVLLAGPTGAADSCPGDADGDGVVTVDDIVMAVNSALYGCAPTPTPTRTPTPGPSDCCQDDGVCGPPRDGACSIGAVIYGAACGGGTGECVRFTPTPNLPPDPLYVRASGSDTHSGADPANALRSIARAAAIALGNYTIIVGPGTYAGGITAARQGATPDGLMFLADTTGSMTGDDAGPVVVDALGASPPAGFSLSGAANGVINGFTISGGADAGIVLKSSSDGFLIENCTVTANDGDGIRVQDSAQGVIFNNLVYRNGLSGIVIGGTARGSAGTVIFSNTIVNNNPRNLQPERGITVGTTQKASAQSLVYNNIIQNNGGDVSIKVITNPRSDAGYDANFNLVLPATYLPTSIAGADDLGVDAGFVDQLHDDYHLQGSSPAINHATELPRLKNPAFVEQLRQQTTTGRQKDTGFLDLGYHFPGQ